MDHAVNLDAGIYTKLKYTLGSSVFQYWHVPCKNRTEGIPNWIFQSREVWIILRESEVLLVGRGEVQGTRPSLSLREGHGHWHADMMLLSEQWNSL